ncbi:MAG: hypothetical protein KME64_28925 [Scytonematopsis contorta HA4267-MV1]|jgi:hypothetical protein|nr:hypothetical protein [Scytonematopsis contorta HA4267-MV1]
MTKKSNSILSSFCLGLGLVLAFVNPVLADNFDNQTIEFDEDTSVEFEFVESRGAYQSTFGIINLATGEKTPLLQEVKPSDNNETTSSKQRDFIGTPGNAVTKPFADFTFKAKTPYSLYLESSLNGKDAGIVYSTNNINKASNQQARLSDNFSGLENGRGVKVNWDDTGSLLVKPSRNDTDFDDFVVIAGGFKPCRYGDNGVVPVKPVPVDEEKPESQPKPPVIPQTW